MLNASCGGAAQPGPAVMDHTGNSPGATAKDPVSATPRCVQKRNACMHVDSDMRGIACRWCLHAAAAETGIAWRSGTGPHLHGVVVAGAQRGDHFVSSVTGGEGCGTAQQLQLQWQSTRARSAVSRPSSSVSSNVITQHLHCDTNGLFEWCGACVSGAGGVPVRLRRTMTRWPRNGPSQSRASPLLVRSRRLIGPRSQRWIISILSSRTCQAAAPREGRNSRGPVTVARNSQAAGRRTPDAHHTNTGALQLPRRAAQPGPRGPQVLGP